ncbi:hypothetical protein BDW66DRAFT_134393 [Aspergillus desertorum]
MNRTPLGGNAIQPIFSLFLSLSIYMQSASTLTQFFLRGSAMSPYSRSREQGFQPNRPFVHFSLWIQSLAIG